MRNRPSLRPSVFLALLAALIFVTSPAQAQFQPRPLNDPATGEKYHIEASAAYWLPNAAVTIASTGLNIPGDTIDAKRDLGLTDKRFPQVRLVLRPGSHHKFKLEYIPIKYDQGPTLLTRDIIFNGQRYRAQFPVTSSIDWKAYRLGYEYDFVQKNRWYIGFIVEAKYTDVQVQLTSPGLLEFARARAPIPALGGVARVYVVPNISITTEITGFKLPDSIDNRYKAHYLDVDVYGTVNFTNNIGGQFGYRSLDVGYLVKTDSGSFVLKGIYFGIVARF